MRRCHLASAGPSGPTTRFQHWPGRAYGRLAGTWLLLVCGAGFNFAPACRAAAPSLQSANAAAVDNDAQARVRDLLHQRPRKELSLDGTFKIRHSDGRRSQVPVKYWLRSEEHTSELQSRVDISYAVFCLKKKK